MKRHMDLVRDVLVFAEGQEDSWFAEQTPIGDWNQRDIIYNVGLAVDAGFLEAKDTGSNDGRDYLVHGITYYGHEFLDHIRSDTVWNKLKALAKQKGVDLTVDLAKSLAPKVVASLFDG